MSQYIFIFFGAGIGGTLRAMIQALLNKTSYLLPFGTITVNLIGCYIIGLIFGMTESKLIAKPASTFIITGILGGFTTFSAFSMETVLLLQKQEYVSAITNILISVVGGIALTYIGYRTIKLFAL
ncbi:MAG TPA: fluoride efflux transporter CrcB [Candidatus Dependentiae bacterium]|nr:fluoride efflux transporter CrcB [Candidatus Dependentiae bacterium]